jgi:chromosome condensin MukBEF ATPase and DNA-binding subunit MukB
MEALEHKKHKMNDLNSQFRERLQQIEKKREEKEAALFNTKSVFGQFNTQKKEITQIKK